LGRLHAITGTVVHGDHRGRELGFPTANLAEITGAVPADGVYAGWLTASVPAAADNAADMAADNAAENTAADGAQAATELRLPAAISIGTNPTFLDGRQRRVEAYVLGRTDLDLYGQQVRLEFLKQVRPTEKFDSVAALIEQMRQDVAQIAALTQPM
jgi:riboflavin kinase/FMN adenylyltransferase